MLQTNIKTFQSPGNRKFQEDYIVNIRPSYTNNNWIILGVLDGHGGNEKDNLSSLLKLRFEKDFESKKYIDLTDKNINNIEYFERKIKKYFLALDKYYLQKKISFGSCVLFSFINLKYKYCYYVNVGDSIGYLIGNNNAIRYKTEIHNLHINNFEFERITNINKDLIINNRYKGVLLPSKVFGDCSLKDNINEIDIISPIPSIKKKQLFKGNKIILTTDGITDLFNDNILTDYILNHDLNLMKKKYDDSIVKNKDNATIIVCYLC